jgi:hypothetical protein
MVCIPARFCINAGHGYVKLDTYSCRTSLRDLLSLAPRCFVFRGQKPTICTDSALPFRSGGGVVCVVRAIMVNIFQRRVYEAPYSTLLKNATGCSSHTSPRNAQLGVELVAASNKFTFLLDASSMTRSCLHPFCQSRFGAQTRSNVHKTWKANSLNHHLASTYPAC